MIALSSCSINTKTTSTGDNADSIAQVSQDTARRSITVTMEISDTIRIGEPVVMKFTVRNDSDKELQFLKWDTPFEPLVSKYLDVKDENGTEVNYIGAMAKRAMPPPSSSYMRLTSGDKLTENVDLLKGYAITKPSRYTVKYVAQGISGLTVKDSVSFLYIK